MANIIRIHAAGVIKALTNVEGALRNPRPYLQMIANELMRVSRQSFEREQSPEGAPWPALSPKYAAWKAKRMPGRGILRAKGQLVRTVFTGVTDRMAFISTANLPHAAMHQYGFNGAVAVPAHTRGPFKRRASGGSRRTQSVKAHSVKAFSRRIHMPARPYLGFPLSSEARVIQDIEQDLAAKGNA